MHEVPALDKASKLGYWLSLIGVLAIVAGLCAGAGPCTATFLGLALAFGGFLVLVIGLLVASCAWVLKTIKKLPASGD